MATPRSAPKCAGIVTSGARKGQVKPGYERVVGDACPRLAPGSSYWASNSARKKKLQQLLLKR